MSKVGEGGVNGIAVAGLMAQQARMRIIAENMANSDSTGRAPGAEPYRRQVPVFQPVELEDESTSVKMAKTLSDPSPFRLDYQPGHPAANAEGYVQRPNVDPLVEAMDMRDAQRAYEANLNVLENQDAIEKRTLDLLKR
ncbi:MAG: flagellar basal body rod protein FlgC [Caulobacterales bacterium]|nr:flagellar basal body rod protein FlgC [Caulobacterales bacterium]